jgi:hypothetical protein
MVWYTHLLILNHSLWPGNLWRVAPVNLLTRYSRIFIKVDWLIDWLLLNVQRAVFQLFIKNRINSGKLKKTFFNTSIVPSTAKWSNQSALCIWYSDLIGCFWKWVRKLTGKVLYQKSRWSNIRKCQTL